VAFGRILKSLLYGVTPQDPCAWGVALIILSVVSFAAALRPAMRAARIDPMSPLRAE
jgi:putative ABC transport system permease protein